MVLRLILGILFLVSVTACTEQKHTENISTEVSPPDGEMIYLNNCVSCHGPDGKLGVSGSFDLTSCQLSSKEIREIIVKGRNGMPPFEYLIKGEDELDALVTFVESMKK